MTEISLSNLAVLKYPATACWRKLKAAAKYLKHGCLRVSNISILILLSCQPLRNSFRFDSVTYVHKHRTLKKRVTALQLHSFTTSLTYQQTDAK